MKSKIKYLLLLFILLVPSFVLAKDTCNDNDIKIKSITLKELNGFSEEIQESSVNNNTINLNLKMYDVGDFSTYDITVENTSNEDYYFTKDSMKLENDYLEYSLKNDSEVIPAKNEKTIELKVSYKNKIPNDNYSDTSKLIISLSDKPLENPKTNTNYYLLVILLVILIPISIKYHKKGLLVLSAFGIISNVYALCTVNLNIETKIEIINKEAIFLTGKEVNIKMKQLAGDDTSTSTNGINYLNESITSINYSSEEPTTTNKEEKNIVSTSESPYPIYMWYDNGTIYWWSEDIHPNLNEDASYMFSYLNNLDDIIGLEYFDTSSNTYMQGLFLRTSISDLTALCHWDVSNVQNMSAMFASTSIQRLNGLENWNTSKVTNMSNIFKYNEVLNDVSSIKNWNVENVKSMAYLFSCCYSLEEIDLSHWKTPALKDMQNMFSMWTTQGTSTTIGVLKRIYLSDNFDTSNVITMNQTFANVDELEDYFFLKIFDTSHVKSMKAFLQYNNFDDDDLQYIKDYDVSQVTDFSYMFFSTKITSVESLKNWNTENAQNMDDMFCFAKSLSDLHGLENWNVTNVTNFDYMFYGDTTLNDASQINNWNIQSSASFTQMFRNVPTHPEFTKVQGTWNSVGTFTPTP